ncbi:MAG: peptidoglycan DD-metalloendopeptidase family protein [Porticoccaceae bacterium]|nr:peptidoglycan DD-metalloendopeptidase family protein [Porticoccaceae bacterium]
MDNLQKFAGFFLSVFREFPRRHLIFAITMTISVLALALYPASNVEPKRQVAEPLTISLDESVAESLSVMARDFELTWEDQIVGAGDNLSTLFLRANLSPKDVYQVSSSKNGQSLRNLYPGEKFRFGTDDKGQLVELHYVVSPLESHVFTYRDGSYSAEKQLREPDVLVSYREGIIQDSLYLSAKKANLPDKLIMEMANIFGWDVDFVFDIRQGDSFSLTFEDKYLEGEKFGVGNILAAAFTNRGKTYKAVRFTDNQGVSNYYTPEGLSMRKAFLRTPLDIFRISSGFNLRRKHPIHKKIKAHRGVDYAAPRGTPVYAAGDGKVVESGYSKANGNYVFVQHGQTYTTKYLHLNRKNVRKGQTVRQRQLIGTVGSTGYATGPHLHYEFLVNGVHRNPRTVKLPQAQPIAEADKATFLAATTPRLIQLAEYQQPTQLAAAKKDGTLNAN